MAVIAENNVFMKSSRGMYVISGFRRKADKNCALLCYYAASSGNFLPTFRDKLSFPSLGFQNPRESFVFEFWNPEDGTDRLSRNVTHKLHFSLRNCPKQRSSQLLRGGSLKPCILFTFQFEIIPKINKILQDAAVCRYLFTTKSHYMFRMSIATIIRST